MRSVTSKSAMTPSLSGRMATMLPGVRPIIRLASMPTATICPVFVLSATTEGSLSTMPRPRTYTSVLAVPRSTAMSRPRKAIALLMGDGNLPDRALRSLVGRVKQFVNKFLKSRRPGRVLAEVLKRARGKRSSFPAGPTQLNRNHARRSPRPPTHGPRGWCPEWPAPGRSPRPVRGRLALVLGVVTGRRLPIQRPQLHRDDAQALTLDPGDDRSDETTADAIGLDEDKSTFRQRRSFSQGNWLVVASRSRR